MENGLWKGLRNDACEKNPEIRGLWRSSTQWPVDFLSSCDSVSIVKSNIQTRRHVKKIDTTAHNSQIKVGFG